MADRKEEDLKSTEHVFIGPRDQIFANKGDSGAAVWDRKGCIVGLLFRGLAPHQTGRQTYALVTPIEDVVKSIIDKSQGNILGVRILGADKVRGSAIKRENISEACRWSYSPSGLSACSWIRTATEESRASCYSLPKKKDQELKDKVKWT
jgi:hypothetical protein